MTNKNAEKKRADNPDKHKSPWRPITSVGEMKAFIGVCVAMGILKLPDLHDYWQKTYRLFEIGQWNEHMSRERFKGIMRYLKFCDEEIDKPQPRDGQDPSPDKLYKVRRFLDKLLPKYDQEWVSHQWLAIDEQMIPFRGRVGFRQFVANKPSRFGIKVWAMADGNNGYILRQQIYTGRNVERGTPEVGLGARVVLDLTAGYQDKNYSLVTDNFYTSPILAQKLLARGIDCLGTVKANNKHFPKDLIFPQKPKPARGSGSWRSCQKILAVSWYDNKPVYFLSTVHSPEHSRDTPQEQREVRRRSKGGAASVPCSPLLHDYNKYMCGIDRADQNNRYYSVKRKCKRWPPRVVFHQLETSINNAFIIYKATQAGKRLTSKEFRMTLATHLMSGYIANNNIPVARRRVNANLEPRLQNVGPHIPVIGPSRVCAVCSARLSHEYKNDKRPRPARSIIRCETCDVHLCLNSNSNCFSVWHRQQKLF